MNYQQFRRIDYLTVDSLGIDPLNSDVYDVISQIEEFSNHEVVQDEEANPALIALRAYRTEDMWWVILIYNAMFDIEEELVKGIILKIPDYPTVVSVLAKLKSDKKQNKQQYVRL